MTREQFEASVDTYLKEVRAKLMLGWDQWRDRAASFSPERIFEEISAEAVDGVGWWFWAWLQTRQAKTMHTPPPR